MVDTQDILTCPACNKEMKKVFLGEQNINIDVCLDGCGGILFDNRELEKCDDSFENISELKQVIADKDFAKTDSSEIRVCPICNTPMVKMGAGKGGVELDNCNVCGAKYLDQGELQKIRNSELEKVSEKVNIMIDKIFKENFEKTTYGMAPEKTSQLRQTVEDVVMMFIMNN